MKYIYTALFSLLLHHYLVAQSSLELSILPSVSYFNPSSDILSQSELNNLYFSEDYRYVLNGGLYFNTKIYRSFFGKIGIGRSTFGYQFDNQNENEGTFIEKQRYAFTHLSLGVGYSLPVKRHSASAWLGIAPSYLNISEKIIEVRENQNLIRSSQTLNNTDDFNSWHWMLRSGLNFDFNIAPRFGVKIGVEGNYMITPIRESVFYRKYYYNLGGKLGILFKL